MTVSTPLRGKKGKGLATLTDVSLPRAWRGPYLHTDGYAQVDVKEGSKWKHYRLHRLIVGIEKQPELEVDHINGNRLDNRRENLRVVLRKGQAGRRLQMRNRANRGSVSSKGVCFDKHANKYKAQIQDPVSNKPRHLGYFNTEKEAAAAYKRESDKLEPMDKAAADKEVKDFMLAHNITINLYSTTNNHNA